MEPPTNGNDKSIREWVIIGLSFATIILATNPKGRTFLRMLKNIFVNWKTTSAGVSLVVVGIVHVCFMFKAGAAPSETDLSATFISILGGIGLIAAGDAGASATKKDVQAVKDSINSGNDKQETTKPNE